MGDTLKFEAYDKPIIEVLYSNAKFQIPRYQRPYAWTEDQVVEFWNDLTNDTETYFFGSFIFNNEFKEETGYIEVVDGQQRILTIMIFLAALRDICKKIDVAESKLIQEFDICITQRDGSTKYRVLCGESTQQYFEEFIQKPENDILNSVPRTKEEKNIKSNYEFFKEKILNELESVDSKSGKLAIIKDLRERIANLIVIEISIWNEEDAYEIFETTNARGVDLNVADLVKNLIFKNIKGREDQDYAKDVWLEIVNNIQSTNTEVKKFLRYFWISKYKFVTEKKLFKAIKNEITDWGMFLEELWVASELFNLLIVGNEDAWAEFGIKNYAKAYRSILAIRIMNVSQCYVLFLSILRNYKKIETDPYRIFRLIEKFTFNYSAVCRLPGNKVERLYSRYAIRLEAEANVKNTKRISGNVQSLFSDLENELKSERPPMEYFYDQFKDLRYKSSQNGIALMKYILAELNNLKEKQEEYILNFNNVNIEHILPKNPDDEWGLTAKDVKDYVNKLGNLTLLSKTINSRIGNKTIKKKIVELQKSKIPITMHIVAQLIEQDYLWNEEKILQRQKNFAEIAYNDVWSF